MFHVIGKLYGSHRCGDTCTIFGGKYLIVGDCFASTTLNFTQEKTLPFIFPFVGVLFTSGIGCWTPSYVLPYMSPCGENKIKSIAVKVRNGGTRNYGNHRKWNSQGMNETDLRQMLSILGAPLFISFQILKEEGGKGRFKSLTKINEIYTNNIRNLCRKGVL